jgi:hypothetical protein
LPRYDQQGSAFKLKEKEVLMDLATFTCSICGETSRHICVFCTKDACRNHLCERCHRCSDCCECEMPVTSSIDEDARPAAAEPLGAEVEATLEAVTPAS